METGGEDMAYTMLGKSRLRTWTDEANSLEGAALSFIRDDCKRLRFDEKKAIAWSDEPVDSDGTSLKKNQIPYNMEKDIDRRCLENAIHRFLKTGKKEDAFDVYFCYLEMFSGGYQQTRRMIELLSEFEVNGSGLLMKHRDHYSHSVYVFILGLAIFKSNESFRKTYRRYYKIEDEQKAAAHYLKYWGFTALFHDIGYPFELPYEQIRAYFELANHGSNKSIKPYITYRNLDDFVDINHEMADILSKHYKRKKFKTTNQLFAYALDKKLGAIYGFSEKQMQEWLEEKPEDPNFMDHAYFSATLLFQKMFTELKTEFNQEYLDALTAILMHNSLFKYKIVNISTHNRKDPLRAEDHPLAYMLMLCDELQCWDRTAYGRNSKKELHPFNCEFDFSNGKIEADYLYDKREAARIKQLKVEKTDLKLADVKKSPLKPYFKMNLKEDETCENSQFEEDIRKIVDLSGVGFHVETSFAEYTHTRKNSYLSDSKFISLYDFAIILNGRWETTDWKEAKKRGKEEQFFQNEDLKQKYREKFDNMSLEYKLSNINQAKSFAKYMHKIGCFYTDRVVDFELVDSFTEDELETIGRMEHRRWLQEHYDMGWVYGTPDKDKRECERKHKDMIPDFEGWIISEETARKNYERLDQATQDKDTEPMECMLGMLKIYDGIKIYRL